MLCALLLSLQLHLHTLDLVVRAGPHTVLVTVEVGSDDFYRASSFYTVPGRVYPVTVRGLPEGTLAVWVTETPDHGAPSTTKRTVFVR